MVLCNNKMSTYTSCCLACRLSQCLSVGWLLAASMHLLRRIATYKVYPQHYYVFNINIWIQQSILAIVNRLSLLSMKASWRRHASFLLYIFELTSDAVKIWVRINLNVSCLRHMSGKKPRMKCEKSL